MKPLMAITMIVVKLLFKALYSVISNNFNDSHYIYSGCRPPSHCGEIIAYIDMMRNVNQ